MSKTTPEACQEVERSLAELRQAVNDTIATRKECEVEQKMSYVVIVRIYDESDIVGVFDNRGDADLLCSVHKYGKVEEHPLNPATEPLDILKSGHSLYTVKMAFDGGVISVDRAFLSAWRRGLMNEDVSIHPGRPYDDFVFTNVIARDEYHARDIAEGRAGKARQCAAAIPGQRRKRAKEEAEREVKRYADDKFRHAEAMERERVMHQPMYQRATRIPTVQGSSAPVGMLPDYIPPEPVKPEPVTEKHVQAAYDKLFGKCLSPETVAEMARPLFPILGIE